MNNSIEVGSIQIVDDVEVVLDVAYLSIKV